MRVLIADKFEQSGRDGLQALGCEISFQPDLKDDALADAIRKEAPDVLVVRGRHSRGRRRQIERGIGLAARELNPALDLPHVFVLLHVAINAAAADSFSFLPGWVFASLKRARKSRRLATVRSAPASASKVKLSCLL